MCIYMYIYATLYNAHMYYNVHTRLSHFVVIEHLKSIASNVTTIPPLVVMAYSPHNNNK